MGYTNVLLYRGGITEWAKSGYPVTRLRKYPEVEIPLVSAKELSEADGHSLEVVDTRPESHYANGHVPGSVNIDMEVMHQRLDRLPREKRIILVDHKGKTSLTTGRFLVSEGFRDVVRLDGGFNGWVKAGLAIAR